MTFIPDPRDLVIIPKQGTGNMGDIGDTASTARFKIDGVRRWALCFIRGGVSGGSANADVVLRVDSRTLGRDLKVVGSSTPRTTPADFKLWEWPAIGNGTGGDPTFKLEIFPDELYLWVFEAGDELVLTWTNPGSTEWAVEVGLVPIPEP